LCPFFVYCSQATIRRTELNRWYMLHSPVHREVWFLPFLWSAPLVNASGASPFTISPFRLLSWSAPSTRCSFVAPVCHALFLPRYATSSSSRSSRNTRWMEQEYLVHFFANFLYHENFSTGSDRKKSTINKVQQNYTKA
jgi:hypothetical protein